MKKQEKLFSNLAIDQRIFRITSSNQAEDFGRFLNQYYKRFLGDGMRNGMVPEKYMGKVYSYCQDHCAKGRLFNAIVDLEITYLFMFKDCFLSGSVWNMQFSNDRTEENLILKDFEKFASKMDILGGLTSFSYRCRAFWDKYMGILVLMYATEHYDRFFKARSRKKTFMKIAENWNDFSPAIRKGLGQIVRNLQIQSGHSSERERIPENFHIPFPQPFLEIMNMLIESLNEIRTAEAHGTGRLRKWSLSMLPLSQSQDFSLYNHWNHANVFMQSLREEIFECDSL